MITISVEWLKGQWTKLHTTGIVPIDLSIWDNGDAYTLASLGPMCSPNVVQGVIVMEGTSIPEVSVAIILRKVTPHGEEKSDDLYNAPDGDYYEAEGLVNDGRDRKTAEVQIVEVAQTIEMRRKTLIESGLLKDASVLVIGLGTGGVQVALELAKSGVGKFILVDSERLDIGNVSRHSAGISHAGRHKVYVARDLLLEKNPSITVRLYQLFADWGEIDLIRQLVREVDLVLCGTDSRASKLFINQICVEERKPAIYGGAFRRAYGGQVLRVYPGQSPCYQCFVMAMPERDTDFEISSALQAREIAYADQPVAIEPGLSIDVAPISIMVAKLALQELLRGKQSTLQMLDRDFTVPWYLWINRPEPATPYATLPPLSESSDEMTILRWYGVGFEREESCPTCGDFERAIRKNYGLEAAEFPVPQEKSLPSNLKIKEE